LPEESRDLGRRGGACRQITAVTHRHPRRCRPAAGGGAWRL
jgi:hypothetical protein